MANEKIQTLIYIILHRRLKMNPTKKQGVNSRVPEGYLAQCTRHVSGIIYIRYIACNVLPLNI
jgi:hypothetical protein